MYGEKNINLERNIPDGQFKRDLSEVIANITKHLITDFEVEEQKEILLSVKENIMVSYEQQRQECMKNAESFAYKVEMFNSF